MRNFFRFGFLIGALLFCVAVVTYAGQTVTVVKVYDGDTVELADGEAVRLIGINAPEVRSKSRATAEPLGNIARRTLTELLDGNDVKLTVGVSSSDRHARTLGYLDLADGTDVQAELLRRGLGFLVAWPPNVSRIEKYRAAELEARAQQKGVWQLPYFAVREAGVAKAARGFQFLRGTVTNVEHDKRYVRLQLNDALTLVIFRRSWKDLWQLDENDLVGKTVTARGWAYHRKRKNKPQEFVMSVRHPYMMEIAK